MKKMICSSCLIFVFLIGSLSPLHAAGESLFLPILLNVFPGFGLGSFIQGDTTGGVILMLGDAASVGMFLIGLFTSIGNFELDFSDTSSAPADGYYLGWTGIICYCVFRVIGIFVPLIFRIVQCESRAEQGTEMSSSSPAIPVRVNTRIAMDAYGRPTAGVVLSF